MANSLEKCPICSLESDRIAPNPDKSTSVVDCPRCGKFRITRPVLLEIADPMDQEVARLLPYLSAYTRQSREMAVIESKNWKTFARSHRNTRVPEKADKLLCLYADRTNIPGERIEINIMNLDYPLIDAGSANEMQYLHRYLKDLGYIDGDDRAARVTVKGWERLQVPAGGVAGRSFVAMSFDESLSEAYELGIKAAIKTDCGLPDPIRMDREQHIEKICDKILADIRTCQFMVADFTYQRAGVYFEAGFAMGLGKPVIWSCREDDFEHLHFDTRQYNHIKWSSPTDLRRKLADRIRATIPG